MKVYNKNLDFIIIVSSKLIQTANGYRDFFYSLNFRDDADEHKRKRKCEN